MVFVRLPVVPKLRHNLLSKEFCRSHALLRWHIPDVEETDEMPDFEARDEPVQLFGHAIGASRRNEALVDQLLPAQLESGAGGGTRAADLGLKTRSDCGFCAVAGGIGEAGPDVQAALKEIAGVSLV